MKRIKCFLIVALLALLGAPHAPAWTIYIIPSGKYIESVYVETTSSDGTTSKPLGAMPGKQINPLDLDAYGRYVITGSDNITNVTISDDTTPIIFFDTDTTFDGETFEYVSGTGWTHKKMYTFEIYYDDAFISSDKVYAQFTNLPDGHYYEGINYFSSTGTAEGYFSRYKGNIWRLSVLSDYDIAGNQPTGTISGPNIKLTGTDGADLTFQDGYIYYATSTTPVEIATNSYYLTATSTAYSSYTAISNPVIKSMKIVYATDGSTVNLSPSADGSTFTYIGSGIKPRANFYVETTDGGSTTTQWFTSYLLEPSKTDRSNWQHRYLSDSYSSITADNTADSYVVKITLSNDKTRINGFECTPISSVTKVALKTADGDATKTLPLELAYNYADDGTTVTSITATATGKIYPSAKYYLELNGSTKLYASTSTENVTGSTLNEIDFSDWCVRNKKGDFVIKSSYISNYDYIKISATLDPDGSVTAFSATPMGRSEVTYSAALPLTEADFTDADGNAKSHYFLVGTRTADWRMLPEWELTPSDDGTAATLSGRIMYRGNLGVAKVDNYSDYCAQKYTIYQAGGTYSFLSKSRTSLTLYNYGSFSAYDYATGKYTSPSGAINWSIDSDSNSIGITSAYQYYGTPAYVNKLTVTLDSSGVPTKISVDDYSLYSSVILDNTSFALVGSDLTGPRNADDVSLDYMSLESLNSGSNTSGWAGSWVSCDADGTPYHVSDGTTLPLTAYDRAWLAAHPVTLYNNAIGKTISSKDITFVPASELADDESDRFRDLYKMHPTVSTSIGTTDATLTSGEFNLKEQIEANGTSEGSISASDWKCYVLKDLWLNGQFKVWTGWGGNIKKFNGVTDDDENAEQWFSVNGGHGIANTDVAVYGYDPKSGTINRLYSMVQNVDSAYFKVKSPSLFNRVLLWYNPSYGLDRSVLQFVQLNEVYLNVDTEHNITTAPTERDDADQCTVVGYTIYRYKRNADGKYIFDGVVKSVSRGDEEYDSKDASYWTAANLIANPITLTDETESEGKVYYAVGYTFEKDGIEWVATTSGIDDSGDGYGDGTYAEGSVDITVFQQTETGTTGDAAGQKLYSFNVEADVTVNLDDDPATMTAHSVIVTADDSTGSLLNTATSFEVDGETISENKLQLNDFSSRFDEISDNYCWEIPIQYFKANSAGKPMVHLVWHNVMPTRTEDGLLKQSYDGYRNTNNSLVTVDDEGFAYTLKAYLIEDQWTGTYTGKLPAIESLSTKPDVLHYDGDYQDEDGTRHYYQGQSLWAYDTDNTQVIAPGVTISNSSAYTTKFNWDMGTSKSGGLYADPSGSRIYNCETYEYEDVRPAEIMELPYLAMGCDCSFLPVTDEVASNFNITCCIYDGTYSYVNSSGETYTSNYISYSSKYMDWRSKMNTSNYRIAFGIGPESGAMGDFTAIDDTNYSGYIHDKMRKTTYRNLIGVYYRPNTDSTSSEERQSAAKSDFISVGNSDDAVFIWSAPETPIVTVNKKSYVKYEDLYFDGTTTESLGYYAHLGLELYISNSCANIGFYAPQQACVPDYDYWPWTTDTYGNELWKHSFYNTSAAYGGVPLCFQYGSGSDAIAPVSYSYYTYEEADASKIEYDSSYYSWSWFDTYKNNWSYLAGKSHRLALMINPVYRYPSKEAYDAGTMDGSIDVTISNINGFVYSYFIYDTTDDYWWSSALNYCYPVFFASASTISVPLNDVSIATGIEEVEGDLTAGDGEAVYYNLQGIRVTNPERGQIYIVRRGNTTTKCLFK